MALPRSRRVRTVPLLLLSLTSLGCPTYGDVVSTSVVPGTRALALGAQALYFVEGNGASYWDAPPSVAPTQVDLKENTAPDVLEVLELGPEGVRVRGLTEGEASLRMRATFPGGEEYPVALDLRVEVPRRAVLTLGSPCPPAAQGAARVLAGTHFGVKLELQSAGSEPLEVGGLLPPVEASPAGVLELMAAGEPSPVREQPFMEGSPGMWLGLQAGSQPGPAALRASVDGTRLDVQVTALAEVNALWVKYPRNDDPISSRADTPLVVAIGVGVQGVGLQEVCGQPRAADLTLRSDTPGVCTLLPGDDVHAPAFLHPLTTGTCRVTLGLPAARGGSGAEVPLRFHLSP